MNRETETNPYLLGNFGPWRLEYETSNWNCRDALRSRGGRNNVRG